MTERKLLLIVEDSPILQHIAKRQLKNHRNIELHVASDGWEALQLVQEHNFALILMDLHLPGMNGWQVTERIRSMRNGRNVPIVAVSADDRRLESIAAGLDDHVIKPTNYGNLVDRWIHAIEITA